MGNLKQSQLRRAENEVVFKQRNEQIQRQVLSVIPLENQKNFMIGFICECSDENCQDRIELPVSSFQRLHTNSKRFILKPGHDQTDVERVIKHHPTYSIVEKHEIPPGTDGILNRT